MRKLRLHDRESAPLGGSLAAGLVTENKPGDFSKWACFFLRETGRETTHLNKKKSKKMGGGKYACVSQCQPKESPRFECSEEAMERLETKSSHAQGIVEAVRLAICCFNLKVGHW